MAQGLTIPLGDARVWMCGERRVLMEAGTEEESFFFYRLCNLFLESALQRHECFSLKNDTN